MNFFYFNSLDKTATPPAHSYKISCQQYLLNFYIRMHFFKQVYEKVLGKPKFYVHSSILAQPSKLAALFSTRYTFNKENTKWTAFFNVVTNLYAFCRTYYKTIMQWRTKNDKYEGCTCGKMSRDKGRFQKPQAQNIPSVKGALSRQKTFIFPFKTAFH